jgi:hypothetical protein
MHTLGAPLTGRCLPRTAHEYISPLQSAHTKATDQNASGTKSAHESIEDVRSLHEHVHDVQRAQKETDSVRLAQEDVEHMDTQPSEYSISGSDNAVAATETTSFSLSDSGFDRRKKGSTPTTFQPGSR